MNWEKLAKERAEDLVVLKVQMVNLVENWNKAARANDSVGERHGDVCGTSNWQYVEHKERARSLRDCAEHLSAVLERHEPLPPPSNPSGAEVGDMEVMRSHGEMVEPSMLGLMAWLIRGRYRSIQHRHDGLYRATDEASGDVWNSDCAVGLYGFMTRKRGA